MVLHNNPGGTDEEPGAERLKKLCNSQANEIRCLKSFEKRTGLEGGLELRAA